MRNNNTLINCFVKPKALLLKKKQTGRHFKRSYRSIACFQEFKHCIPSLHVFDIDMKGGRSTEIATYEVDAKSGFSTSEESHG